MSRQQFFSELEATIASLNQSLDEGLITSEQFDTAFANIADIGAVVITAGGSHV